MSHKTCAICFHSENRDCPEAAFSFFTKAIQHISPPIFAEFRLLGTAEEISEIVDDPKEKFVIVRLGNGGSNWNKKNEKPNGSVLIMGSFDREQETYVRIELDLSTGRGTITRIY